MSIEYIAVDKKRKQAFLELQAFLDQEKQDVLERTEQFLHAHPDMVQQREEQLYRIRTAKAFQAEDYKQPTYRIGIRTRRGIRWWSSNGFNSTRSVSEFLATHPGWVIENEYGDEVSFEQFEKVAGA